MSAGYRVEHDLFTGPLDLLLYLVRRNEVAIVDFPIAEITRQFLDFLEVLEQIDLDLIGDFVVMASTLVEMKSRSVLPSEEEEAAPEEIPSGDPPSALVKQLLEYKRFKEAASALELQAESWRRRYPRLADDRPSVERGAGPDRIKEVELWDLVSALGRILKRPEVESRTTIRYDETPIHVYVERIGEYVRSRGSVEFTSLFEKETSRSQIIGMFLAVLELVRHHHFRAEQAGDYGEILILPPLVEDGALTPSDSSGQAQ